VYLVWQPFFLAVLVLFAALAPFPFGLFPLAALHLQALVAIGGTAITSRDLLLAFAGRSLLELLRWGELIALPQKDAKRADPSLALRPVYRELLKDGIERFFEPRRETCPLCDGKELFRFIELPDFFQRKPGRFRLDRCRGCGHLFQNPRLSIAGLDFYYKDFYEGLGGDGLDTIFGFSGDPYVARAKQLVGVAEPTRWLDVGGGHGHFCNTARDIFPRCAFDGLDMGEAMAEGARRGWVDEAFLGLFPELAGKLANRYDVVSMSHYLEHTRDQRAEIAAASTALKEGGHFLLEVPDPECPIGRALGGFWLPWFQPQHQHLTSAANMRKLLEAAGFEVVKEVRGPAHIPVDLAFATVILMKRIAPDPAQPWRPPDPAAVRLWGGLVWTVGLPILGLAYLTDRLTGPIWKSSKRGNAYRMLARKPSSDDPPIP
jgi:SAM-dependent methyltransferase